MMKTVSIIAAQLKAGRILAGLSQADVARKAGVELLTVRRAEASGSVAPETIAKIVEAIEAAGIEFTNGKMPGVRLRVGRR
jgi:transcriptional regulator with XRE-family HTH domain